MGTRSGQKGRWKGFEDEVARWLHTIRSGVSKTDEAGKATRSDTKHQSLYAECKYRLTSTICSLLVNMAAKATVEGKIPAAAMKSWRMQGFVWAVLTRFWQQSPIYDAKGEYVGQVLMLKKAGLLDKKEFYRFKVYRDAYSETTITLTGDRYRPEILPKGMK